MNDKTNISIILEFSKFITFFAKGCLKSVVVIGDFRLRITCSFDFHQ